MKRMRIFCLMILLIMTVHPIFVSGLPLWKAELIGDVPDATRRQWGVNNDANDQFICPNLYMPFRQKSLGLLGKGRGIPDRTISNIPPHYGLSLSILVHNAGFIDNFVDHFVIKFDGTEIFNNIVTVEITAHILNCLGGGNSGRPKYVDYYNPTHTNPSFVLKFIITTDEDIPEQGYLMRDLRIYINECHSTCLSCNGSLKTQCTSCPGGALVGTDGSCQCPFPLVSYNHDCISICPTDYAVNPSSEICQKICITSGASQNCVTCSDTFNCQLGSCGAYGQNYKGKCVSKCPSDTFLSGSDCVLHENDTSWSQFGRMVVHEKLLTEDYFPDSEITNRFQITRSYSIVANEWKQGESWYCFDERIAGGLLQMGMGNVQITYTDLPPHINVQVVVRLYAIGSWDTKSCKIYIDGSLIKTWTVDYTQSQPSCSLFDWGDTVETLILYPTSHTSPNLEIKFDLILDTAPPYQTFGYRDYYLILDLCPENCDICTTTACTSCKENQYLINSTQCVTDCGSGYYKKDAPAKTCEVCNYQCASCETSQTNCLICADIRINSPSCDCPDGFYAPNLVATCSKCYFKCSKCLVNTESVDDCYFNLVYHCGENRNQDATCSCVQGYYEPSITDSKCGKCDPSCQSCNGPKLTDCLTCSSSSDFPFKLGTTCVSDCPSDYYYKDETNFVCDPCHSSCKICSGTGANQCLSCSVSTFLKQDFTCASACDASGFFSDLILRQCIPCPANCDLCSGPDSCLVCLGALFLQEGGCVTDCPITGYFSDITNQVCVRCHPTCKTCSNQLEITCISCYDDAYLFKGIQCVKSCENLYYPNENPPQKCQTCPEKCSKCNTATMCTQCSPGYYLTPDYDDPTEVLCYSICPRGSLKIPAEKQCQSCRFKNQIMFLGRCIPPPCPVYYALNATYKDCVPCYETCSACTGDQYSECTECKPGYYLQINGLNSQCVNYCSAGFYTDSLVAQCVACSSNCLLCTKGMCEKCFLNFYLQADGRCYNTCPSGTYPDNEKGICSLCHPACKTCKGGQRMECLSCDSPLYLFGSTCVPDCPNGYYKNVSVCSKCDTSCVSCNGPSNSNCLACTSNTILDGGKCLASCSTPRYYANKQKGICEPCDTSCETCYGPTQYHCSSCRSGTNKLLVDNSHCDSSCPQGTFTNSSSCVKCYFTCLTCNGLLSNNCLNCKPGYYFNAEMTTCVIDCPSGKQKNSKTGVCDPASTCTNQKYLDSNNICQNCHSSCYRCAGPADTQCKICLAPLFLNSISNQCVAVCDVGYYGDSSTGICLKCLPQCESCVNQADNCTACKVPQRILSKKCECPSGIMIDEPSGACPACKYNCNSCSILDFNCVSCASNRINIIPLCPCPPGFFNVENEAQCRTCDFKCQTCYGLSSKCIICKGDRTGDSCNCPSGTYDDGVSISCQPCEFKCGTCKDSKTNCLTCLGDRKMQLQCGCSPGQYEDGIQFNCPNCSFQCSSCVLNQGNCTQCRGDRINAPNCLCIDGQYDDDVTDDCQTCDSTCTTCTKIGCLTCAANRIGPFINQCNCPPDIQGISRISLGTPYCTTCDLGVTEASFSNNLSRIIISVGGKLLLTNDDLANTNKLCLMVLQLQFIERVGGTTSICGVENGDFFIQLGIGSVVDQGEVIKFKENSDIIQLDGCYNDDGNPRQISKFNDTTVKMPDISLIAIPEIFTNQIEEIYSLCRDITIEILKYQNTGERYPPSVQWELSTSNPSNSEVDNQLKKILSEASTENQKKINIPFLLLASFTSYEITITYQNFVGVGGSQTIKIKTSSTESIEINIDSIRDKSFITRTLIKFVALIDHLNCGSGKVEKQNSELNVQWEFVNGTKNPQSAGQLFFSSTQNSSQIAASWQINQFVLPIDSVQEFKVSVFSKEKSQVTASTSWKIQILVSKLQTIIKGGNRMAGYSSIIQFEGQSTDLDIPDDKQKEFKVSLTWTCINVNTNDVCKNLEGVLIPLSTDQIFTIGRKQLEPYQAYIIQLFGQQEKSAPSKISSAEITLIITELDLPVLEVDVPDYMTSRKINLNEKIKLSIKYPDTNPDTLFYSGVFLYKLDPVGVKIFEYLEFNFQIWETFVGFTFDNTYLTFKCSIYNPLFIMPSQTSITFEVNIPPQKCEFYISEKNEGTEKRSLESVFRLRVTKCIDSDQPLNYRFGYYMNSSIYDKDILNSLNGLNLNYLNDFNSDQYLDTFLIPSNEVNATYYEPIIVYAQIIDALGGITNLTLNTTILPVSSTYISDTDAIMTTINNLQLNINSEISQLSVVAFSLSAFETEDFTQIDLLIISRLNFHLSNNPIELWKEQIAQTLGVVNNKKNVIENMISNKTEIDSSLNVLKQFIKSQSQTSTSIETLLNSGTVEALSLTDTISINMIKSLDTVTSLLISSSNDSFIEKFNINPNQTIQDGERLQIINQRNKIMIDQVQQIDDLLKAYALPNEPAKEFSSSALNLQSQVLTSKQLLDFLNPTDTYQIIGDEQEQANAEGSNKSNNNNGQKSSNYSFGIYNFGLRTFNKNPYAAEKSFPYPLSKNQVYDMSIQNHNSQTNSSIRRLTNDNSSGQLNIPPADFYFNKANNPINQSKNESSYIDTSYSNTSIEQINYTRICIQKNLTNSGTWTKDSCLETQIKDSEGNVQGSTCKCKDYSPTTIVEDINNLFTSNKVQQAFDKDSISKLAGWKFWQVPLFYSLIGITGTFIITLVWGLIKDKQDQRISPQPQKSLKLESVISINQEQQIQKMRSIQQVQIIENDQQKKDNRDKDDILMDEDFINILNIDNNLSSRQKNDVKSDHIMTPKIGERDNIVIIAPKNTHEQQMSSPKTNKELKLKFNRKTLGQVFKLQHTYISIFYVFSEQESRPRRFTLEYIQMIVYLVVMLGFTKTSTIQTVALAIFSAIVTKIVMAIVGNLLSDDKNIKKVIGAFLTFSICGLCAWIVLILLAISDEDDIQETFYKFISQILNDYLFLDSIKCFLRLAALIIKSRNEGSQNMLIKLLFIFHKRSLMIRLNSF